jgi:hypothetical protein
MRRQRLRASTERSLGRLAITTSAGREQHSASSGHRHAGTVEPAQAQSVGCLETPPRAPRTALATLSSRALAPRRPLLERSDPHGAREAPAILLALTQKHRSDWKGSRRKCRETARFGLNRGSQREIGLHGRSMGITKSPKGSPGGAPPPARRRSHQAADRSAERIGPSRRLADPSGACSTAERQPRLSRRSTRLASRGDRRG